MSGLRLESFRRNSRGFRAILTSPEVAADLERRADQVKAAADAQLATLDAPYPPVVVNSTTGTTRASATIGGVPLPLERSRRILGSAIDAAAT